MALDGLGRPLKGLRGVIPLKGPLKALKAPYNGPLKGYHKGPLKALKGIS